VDVKTLSFYYLFFQRIKTAQRGWFTLESLQHASASCFDCSLTAVTDVIKQSV